MGYDEALKLQIKEADIFKPYSKEERKRYEREHPIPPPPKGGRKIYIFAKFAERMGGTRYEKIEVDENYLLAICNPGFNESRADWLEDEEVWNRYVDIISPLNRSDLTRKQLLSRLKKGKLPIGVWHEEGAMGIAFTKQEAAAAAKKIWLEQEEGQEEGWE